MALKLGSLIRGRRRRRARLEHQAQPVSPRTQVLVRLLLASLILAATVLLFPTRVTFNPPTYRAGDIAEEEIIAPFSYEVGKAAPDLERERARAAESVLPVFMSARRGRGFQPILDRLEAATGDRQRLGHVLDSLRISFSAPLAAMLASPDSGRVLTREAAGLLEQALGRGLVGEEDANLLRGMNRIRLSTAAGVEVVPTYQVFDMRRLSERAAERGMERLGPEGAEALADLVRALAVTNLIYDHAVTEQDRQAARAAVSPVQTTIQEGERIVHAHERITPEHEVVLAALQDAHLLRSSGRGLSAWFLPILGQALLVAVFLGLMVVHLRIFRREVWEDLGLLALVAVVSVLTLALAGVVARSPSLNAFLVPIPLAAVLITILIGDVLAMGLVVGLASLVGAVAGWGLPVTLISGAGGIIACFATRNLCHRMDFIRSILPIALGMIATMLGLALVGPGMPWSALVRSLGWLVGNAALSVALAMVLLPILEKVFGLASNITLLELSDLNRPIFKRMMLEANGTYHHSMIVGSLSEVAAEAVGANPLLARVGGYYHDIGKIAKSGYFGENLREGMRNPHEKLTPHMSSLILESHVRDGLEMAREIGLPKTVASFIPEHQGTTLMQYFFNKALEMDPDVEELDYRYPGPRPRCKETAVVMLADASEATVRSLDDQAPKQIRAVLANLFEARIADGQLDDCGLTMADLARIREAFTHALTGVFHGRVKYQWQKEGEEALAGSRGPRVFHPELETGIGTRERPRELTRPSKTAGEPIGS